jgi:hypothetical protein
MTAGPYRGGSGELRFVCLACYAHASIAGGLCPRCGVDLLSLENEDVRADLRAEAERRMQSRQYSEYFGIYLAAFLAMSPLLALLAPGIMFQFVYILVSLGLGRAGHVVYTRLRPNSALALYATRGQRLESAMSGKATPRLPAPREPKHAVESGKGDPEDLTLTQTMRWLGIVADGESKK